MNAYSCGELMLLGDMKVIKEPQGLKPDQRLNGGLYVQETEEHTVAGCIDDASA